jgi:hypothetical protein
MVVVGGIAAQNSQNPWILLDNKRASAISPFRAQLEFPFWMPLCVELDAAGPMPRADVPELALICRQSVISVDQAEFNTVPLFLFS